MDEQKIILDMLEQGKITSVEALELLNALKEGEEKITQITEVEATPKRVKKEYKYLKIKVDTDEGNTKVNVNLPLKFIKVVGGAIPALTTMIPKDAKDKMETSGININEIDIAGILSALEEGLTEDTTIIDVVTNDESGSTKVKIYVE